MMTLVREICNLGEKLEDEAVIEILFYAVPDKFVDVVNTIEQWGDLSTMPVAEASGRQVAFENGQCGHRKSNMFDICPRDNNKGVYLHISLVHNMFDTVL